MPRIVFDARSVVRRRSGIGNYAEALLRHLVPLASDCEFLVLRHPDEREPLLRDPRVEELAFEGETKSIKTVFSLGRRFDFADYDLYHSPADLIPLGLRCPWVVTIHDLMWVEAPALASAFLPVRLGNGIWYRTNIARSIRGARGVIAISNATKAAIERVYPRHAHKVSVVHHGMDHARYSRQNAAPRTLLDKWLTPEQRYSLIVGQGSPYKNHLRMLQAFLEATRDQPEHKLVLVRRFSRVDRPMTRLLSEPRVRDKVISVPFVSDDELSALYAHAHMLLFASLYEGFGLPALEAMCLGVPVLGSTAPAVLEITGEAALHADPTSHSDLVRCMRALDRDPALRERLSQAGPARARDFSWPICAQRTLAVYRAALADQGSAAARHS
jgi:glycosyltransferase involved in cell wall biosynthesis